MREKTKGKNDLTFKFYIDDFVLKIPFKLSSCLGFAKIGENKKNQPPVPSWVFAYKKQREGEDKGKK